MARAIQFFTPGTPQVYYVGMLAGQNDLGLVEETRNGRDINRHNYNAREIETEAERTVVKRLKKLMQFRLNCRAFKGEFSIDRDSESAGLVLEWKGPEESAALSVEPFGGEILITRTGSDGAVSEYRP
jgi:sucrose phosphorylase